MGRTKLVMRSGVVAKRESCEEDKMSVEDKRGVV